jgi:hypothetical protein
MVLQGPDPNSKFHQNYFIPKNPQKVIGSAEIVCRSSWEMVVCRFFDDSPFILSWGSECISIPYLNPFKPTGQQNSMYYPDFFVISLNSKGEKVGTVIEIKPSKQTDLLGANKLSKYDLAQLVLNQVKWKAAEAFCKKKGLEFKIWTEAQLFTSGLTGSMKGKMPKRHTRKTGVVKPRVVRAVKKVGMKAVRKTKRR